MAKPVVPPGRNRPKNIRRNPTSQDRGRTDATEANRSKSNVDDASTMRLIALYSSDEIGVAAYEGDTDDFARRTIANTGQVIHYQQSGHFVHARDGYDVSTDKILRRDEVSDAYDRPEVGRPFDPGVSSVVTARVANSVGVCIMTKQRAQAPYDVWDYNNNEEVLLPGPEPGEREHLVMILKGEVDWGDHTQAALIDHIEIVAGDDALGTANGSTKILVVR